MRKFLLTASMLVAGVVATFAQGWQVGEEITGKIGNPSFKEDAIAPWIFEHKTGSTTEKGGLCEIYDGDGADLYQYIELPAGMYRLECQGYYRIGQSWDVDPQTFNTDDWVDRAFLYAQNGKYNIDSKEFTGGRTFQTPLMPRLFPLYQGDQIYNMEAAGDQSSWDMSDGQYTVNGVDGQIWGPTSVNGSLKWFERNLYAPVNDGEHKYNTVTFFLTEDGYVKIGTVKAEKNSADSWMVTDFKLYYEGEAGEAAELQALEEEIQMYIDQLNTIKDNNEGFLNVKADEAVAIYEMEYSPSTKEEYQEAKAYLVEQVEGANQAVKDMASLKAAISAAKALNSSNAELLAKIEEAEASLQTEGFEYNDQPWSYYGDMTAQLNEARLAALMDQPADEMGAKNFTALISFPWFCNPEYEPTWDAENKTWVPNEAVLATGWASYDDVDGTKTGKAEVLDEATGDVKTPAAPAIASMVEFGKVTDTGKWYQENNGLVVYWNDKLTCAKKWDMPHNDDTRRVVAQNLANIPNGFYKLKILAQTWTNDWTSEIPCKNHAFAKAGDKEVVSPDLEPGGWWGTDINQWKELETDMIEVTDGTLTIGAFDNGFAAITGFRLDYYGDTPDYQALIAPDLQKAQTDAEALKLGGDKAAVAAMLAKVPEQITTKEEYLEAAENIKAANDYIKAANTAISNWKAVENFTTLAGQFGEGTPESEFLFTAMMASMDIEENQQATYKDTEVNNAQYNAYKEYVDYRQSIANFLSDATVAPTVEKQNADLAQNFASVETIKAYMETLGAAYNTALFEAEGINKATIENPIELTERLLKNYEFREGPTAGWTGVGANATINEFGNDEETHTPEVAEVWNTGAFTISQTLAGLPAGTYEIKAQALYRDGGGVDKGKVDEFNKAGNEENWANHNAVLFAKSTKEEWTSYLSAIESLKSTKDSFMKVTTSFEKDPEDPTAIEIKKISYVDGTISEDEKQEGITYTSVGANAYPFDTKISFAATFDIDGNELTPDVNYFYPQSMQGFHEVCKQNPDAYNNSVIAYLPEGGNLEIGIRKDAAISGDWVIMEKFQIFYLGKDAPTAVKDIETAGANKAAVSEVYSVSGARQNGLQKGINIVKYSNGTVRKVFVK